MHVKIHAELSVGMKLDFWGFIKLSQDLHQDLLDPSRQDDKWFKVISKLENRDRIGSSLNLRCAKHPRDDGMVKTAEDFDRKALHGGCQRDCDTLLPRCGHHCHLKCHPFDPEHKDGIRASKQPFSVHPPSLTAKDVVCNNFCSRPWPSCLDLYPCAWRRLNFSLHSALSVSHLSTLNTITASVWRFRALCSRNCHVGNRAWPLLWSGRPRPPGCTHDCKRLCKLLGCSCITTLDQKPLESAGEALGTFGRGLRSSGIFEKTSLGAYIFCEVFVYVLNSRSHTDTGTERACIPTRRGSVILRFPRGEVSSHSKGSSAYND